MPNPRRSPRKRAKRHTPLYGFDLETDPFTPGQMVQPFVWGVWDGAGFDHEWHEDPRECIASFVRYARTLRPGIITAHNGGRFDFMWLLEFLDPDPTIINGRIVQARMEGHILHDSFATHPEALAATGNKLKFDYARMRKGVRQRFRPQIVDYLAGDCRALWDMVTGFHARFGHKITMASAAIQKLKATELPDGTTIGDNIERLSLRQDQGDERFCGFRRFYYGGRVQAFEQGVLRDDWKSHDVTGMYQDVMANVQHPVGNIFGISRRLDDETDFAIVDARSRGALPLRKPDGGLSFPHTRAIFHATGHELRTAIELGMLDVLEVHAAYSCSRRMDFAPFILEYTALKDAAEAAGDKMARSHWKRVQNSSYGRFSLDPQKLFAWRIVINPTDPIAPGQNDLSLSQLRYLDEVATLEAEGFRRYQQGPAVTMFRRLVDPQQQQRALLNVATGASITGAARAKMLRGLAAADRPVYCDTDSIISRGLAEGPGVAIGRGLGEWKLEAEGDRVAIAGKKLYALFIGMRALKIASKGARLTASQIVRVARGQVVHWENLAPTFGVAGLARFVARDIKMTSDGKTPRWGNV